VATDYTMKTANVFVFEGYPPTYRDDNYVDLETISFLTDDEEKCRIWLSQNGWFDIQKIKQERMIVL